MLTEEERKFIDDRERSVSYCSSYEEGRYWRIIDRLVAENKELKKGRCEYCGSDISDGCIRCGAPQCCHQCCRIQFFEDKLDAIRKAAESLCDLIPTELRNSGSIGNSNYVNAKIGDLKALDKLIGGE